MKIHVDEKNNRVIATGYRNGRMIRAIANCQEPEFNEEFGRELATKKYNIKYEMVRQREHESVVRALHRMVLWCYKVIDDEQEIINRIHTKVDNLSCDCKNFVDEYFKGEK